MNKLVALSILVLGFAQGNAMAATSEDPVTGTVHATERVAKDVGNGTVDAAKHVGKAAGDVVEGAGKAVESVGKGAADLVTGK